VGSERRAQCISTTQSRQTFISASREFKSGFTDIDYKDIDNTFNDIEFVAE
jgi:hypothetical protein